MADVEQVKQEIESKLRDQGREIKNRNALDALFGAIGGMLPVLGPVIENLWKVFNPKAEIDAARQQIAQEVILRLICKIDDALEQANASVSSVGSPVTIAGFIEVIARDGDQVVGVAIGRSAGPVNFELGTRIRAETNNVKSVVGLQIGDHSGTSKAE